MGTECSTAKPYVCFGPILSRDGVVATVKETDIISYSDTFPNGSPAHAKVDPLRLPIMLLCLSAIVIIRKPDNFRMRA